MLRKDCNIGMTVQWESGEGIREGCVTVLGIDLAYIKLPSGAVKTIKYRRISPKINFGFEKETTTKSWCFSSLHEKDIDFEEIRKDLTRQNPVAIVTVKIKSGEDEYYLLIHDSIIEKDRAVNSSSGRIKQITRLSSQSHISSALLTIKSLKGTPWPEKGRRKAKVNVVLPKI